MKIDLREQLKKEVITNTRKVVLFENTGKLYLRIGDYETKIEISSFFKEKRDGEWSINRRIFKNIFKNACGLIPMLSEAECEEIYKTWLSMAERAVELTPIRAVLSILMNLQYTPYEDISKVNAVNAFIDGNKLYVSNTYLIDSVCKLMGRDDITLSSLGKQLRGVKLRTEYIRMRGIRRRFWVFSLEGVKVLIKFYFNRDWEPKIFRP